MILNLINFLKCSHGFAPQAWLVGIGWFVDLEITVRDETFLGVEKRPAQVAYRCQAQSPITSDVRF